MAFYSRNSFPKINDGAYVVNLDAYESIEIHGTTLDVSGNNIIYFDSFRVEHIPKEIKKFIGNRNTITKIYSIQAYGLIMFG